VLVVAALLAGAGLGAAVFASLWRHEASSREAAEAKLTQARGIAIDLRAEIAGLQSRLDASRKTAAAAGKAARQGSAHVSALAAGAQPLIASAGSLEDQAGSLTDRSNTLSSLIGTLNKDLAALTHYVGDSNAGTLDPAFLKTQLGYLTPNLDKVGAASASLAAEVGTYSKAVQWFVYQLSAYAKTIRPPSKP